MNNPMPPAEETYTEPTREEMMSALFANMVIQQTNMAMMFLGKVPHPETGQIVQDAETARMFIDQLEMLEFKTRGNLTKQEAGLLKQGLTALHMGYVEAFGGPAPSSMPPESAEPKALAPEEPKAAQPARAEPVAAAPAPAPSPAPQPAAAPEPREESRKKFTKKY